MNIKLGCKQFSELYLTWSGFGRDRLYSCTVFDLPVPNEKDEKHYVTCPFCKQEIPIVIVGKESAKTKRIAYFILGSLIAIPFLYLIIFSIINLAYNGRTILILIVLFLVGYMLSYVPFSKAIENKFYSKGYTYAPRHKIFYK
jgi:hypothetical protein